jgi:hypothetical protein
MCIRDSSNVTQTANGSNYQAVNTELFEVVARKTYLRAEPDINSPELDPINHGELLINLGQSSTDPDWFQIQDFSGDQTGYLYQQWISPIHGQSVEGMTAATGDAMIFADDFSGLAGTWYEDSFDDDFGQGKFEVTDGVYQVDLNAKDGGYIYSKIELNELPPTYVLSVSINLVSANDSSAAGFMTNFMDEDNFDYFLLTSEGAIVIGSRRNGENYTLYNTQSTPNRFAEINQKQPNTLSVWVSSATDAGPNHFTYAVNGKSIYTLQFNTPQPYSPAVGVIVWSMAPDQPVIYNFDNVSVSQANN